MVVDVVVEDAVVGVAVVEVLPVGEFADGVELQAATSSAAPTAPPTASKGPSPFRRPGRLTRHADPPAQEI